MIPPPVPQAFAYSVLIDQAIWLTASSSAVFVLVAQLNACGSHEVDVDKNRISKKFSVYCTIHSSASRFTEAID